MYNEIYNNRQEHNVPASITLQNLQIDNPSSTGINDISGEQRPIIGNRCYEFQGNEDIDFGINPSSAIAYVFISDWQELDITQYFNGTIMSPPKCKMKDIRIDSRRYKCEEGDGTTSYDSTGTFHITIPDTIHSTDEFEYEYDSINQVSKILKEGVGKYANFGDFEGYSLQGNIAIPAKDNQDLILKDVLDNNLTYRGKAAFDVEFRQDKVWKVTTTDSNAGIDLDNRIVKTNDVHDISFRLRIDSTNSQSSFAVILRENGAPIHGGTDATGFLIGYFSSSQELMVRIRHKGTSSDLRASNNPLTLNKWHNIRVLINQTSVSFFVDNVPSNVFSYTDPLFVEHISNSRLLSYSTDNSLKGDFSITNFRWNLNENDIYHLNPNNDIGGTPPVSVNAGRVIAQNFSGAMNSWDWGVENSNGVKVPKGSKLYLKWDMKQISSRSCTIWDNNGGAGRGGFTILYDLPSKSLILRVFSKYSSFGTTQSDVSWTIEPTDFENWTILELEVENTTASLSINGTVVSKTLTLPLEFNDSSSIRCNPTTSSALYAEIKDIDIKIDGVQYLSTSGKLEDKIQTTGWHPETNDGISVISYQKNKYQEADIVHELDLMRTDLDSDDDRSNNIGYIVFSYDIPNHGYQIRQLADATTDNLIGIVFYTYAGSKSINFTIPNSGFIPKYEWCTLRVEVKGISVKVYINEIECTGNLTLTKPIRISPSITYRSQSNNFSYRAGIKDIKYWIDGELMHHLKSNESIDNTRDWYGSGYDWDQTENPEVLSLTNDGGRASNVSVSVYIKDFITDAENQKNVGQYIFDWTNNDSSRIYLWSPYGWGRDNELRFGVTMPNKETVQVSFDWNGPGKYDILFDTVRDIKVLKDDIEISKTITGDLSEDFKIPTRLLILGDTTANWQGSIKDLDVSVDGYSVGYFPLSGGELESHTPSDRYRDLDSNTDAITVTDNQVINSSTSTDYTVQILKKYTSPNDDLELILQGRTSGAKDIRLFRNNTNDGLQLTLSDGGSVLSTISSVGILGTLESWETIGIRITGLSGIILKDGVEHGVISLSSIDGETLNDIGISSTTEAYKPNMYFRQLTKKEGWQLPLNEFTGTVAYDRSVGKVYSLEGTDVIKVNPSGSMYQIDLEFDYQGIEDRSSNQTILSWNDGNNEVRFIQGNKLEFTYSSNTYILSGIGIPSQWSRYRLVLGNGKLELWIDGVMKNNMVIPDIKLSGELKLFNNTTTPLLGKIRTITMTTFGDNVFTWEGYGSATDVGRDEYWELISNNDDTIQNLYTGSVQHSEDDIIEYEFDFRSRETYNNCFILSKLASATPGGYYIVFNQTDTQNTVSIRPFVESVGGATSSITVNAVPNTWYKYKIEIRYGVFSIYLNDIYIGDGFLDSSYGNDNSETLINSYPLAWGGQDYRQNVDVQNFTMRVNGKEQFQYRGNAEDIV